jgi:hypothetical protein
MTVENAYLELEGHRFPATLYVFTLGGFDIVLGMDWLAMFEATILCKQKMARLKTLDGSQITVRQRRDPSAEGNLYDSGDRSAGARMQSISIVYHKSWAQGSGA